MDPARLTQKSQQALHDAQTKALRLGNNEVDGEHLLLALTDQADGIVPRLLTQAGVDTEQLRTSLEADLGRRPRVSGPGAAPGQVNVTQRLSRLLDTAEQEAGRLKDEYVSVEHLLLALLSEGMSSAAGRLLAEQRVHVELVVGRSVLEPYLRQVHLELLGDQHRDRGIGPLPHLDIWHDEGDLPVAVDADEGVGREPVALGRLRPTARRRQVQAQHEAAARGGASLEECASGKAVRRLRLLRAGGARDDAIEDHGRPPCPVAACLMASRMRG